MIKATLKSLLGRKLRLLMSTFAIVLGVAFVGGSLIFSDTLGRSFTALFASTVGDVVVRPADAGAGLGASTVTIPASVVDDLESRAGRRARRRQRDGVRGLRRRQGQQGRRRPGSAGDRRQLLRRPGGSRPPGARPDPGARRRTGPTRWSSTRRPPSGRATTIGERVHIVTSSDQALLTPKLVGIARLPRGRLAQRRDVRARSTPRPRRTCSSRAQDAYTDIWVTADDGVSQDRAARTRSANGSPTGTEAVTGDTAADEAASDLLEAISFLRDVPADLRRHLAGRRRVPDRQHLLDPGRPAQPRARPAACARCVEATGDPFGAVRGVRGRRRGLHARARPRRAAGHGDPGALRELRSRPDRSAADLRPAHRAGLLRRRRRWSRWRPRGCPARRTTRIAPVQALRDDIALPETSIHRRLLLGLVGIGVGAGGDGCRAVHRRPARRLGARRSGSSSCCSV